MHVLKNMPQGAPLRQKNHPIKPKKIPKKVKQILTISYKKAITTLWLQFKFDLILFKIKINNY